MQTDAARKRGVYERVASLIENYGWRATGRYLLEKFLHFPIKYLRLRPKDARFPLWARVNSSDLAVYRQIFREREFRCLGEIQDAGLIIDCGANVGYASAYFLTRYPKAFVVAVEPDSGNFRMLEKNLAPYAGRYRLIQSAVWSKNTGLVVSSPNSSEQNEWGITVREAQPGETAQLQALTINELMADCRFDRITLLKIDIEGAEKEVFAGELEPWLSKTDILTIELHSAECTHVFQKAVAAQKFTISNSGELTICKRI